MKKIYCVLTLVIAVSSFVIAQDEEVMVRNANKDPLPAEKEAKKQKLFTGGNITVSFYSGGSILGASPVLGYKLNDYLDAGVVLNYVYQGSRDVYVYNDKLRQHVYGPGVFARVYPVSFLFAQAQLEQNFTNIKYISPASATPTDKYSANATSLLVGAGLSTGRSKGGTSFFYFSVLADVLKNRNSPYVDLSHDPNTGAERIRIVPVIRAGVNVGLFQKRFAGYEAY